MISSLVLHPKTKQQLELSVKRSPQVLLLHGKKGVGLRAIAREVAHEISDQNNTLEISPDEKGSIKIDTIRQLYSQTRTKKAKKMIIIINDADAMQAPAQNALLKLLEDTPKDTLFILATHYPQILLPTVRSRAQETDILPITKEQTARFISKAGTFDDAERAQLLFLAQGLPAEISRLSENQEYRDRRIQEMSGAKNFLAKPLYEKLVFIYKLPNDRTAALSLLEDCMHIIQTTLRLRPGTKLAWLLQDLLSAEQKILNDGHVRTQLLKLAVSLA
jgi:DNA polymerase III delta prime subunit